MLILHFYQLSMWRRKALKVSKCLCDFAFFHIEKRVCTGLCSPARECVGNSTTIYCFKLSSCEIHKPVNLLVLQAPAREGATWFAHVIWCVKSQSSDNITQCNNIVPAQAASHVAQSKVHLDSSRCDSNRVSCQDSLKHDRNFYGIWITSTCEQGLANIRLTYITGLSRNPPLGIWQHINI